MRLEGHADERASELYNLELAGERNDGVQVLLREIGLGDLPVTEVAYGEAVPAVASTGPARAAPTSVTSPTATSAVPPRPISA